MKLVIKGQNLAERLHFATLTPSMCQGDVCTTHDGCGEQCNHSRCRY